MLLQSTLPEDATTLSLCCFLGYKPIVRRGTQLHVEVSPVPVPGCVCSPGIISHEASLALESKRKMRARVEVAAAETRPSNKPQCSCSAPLLQHLGEVLFGDVPCAAACSSISLVEVVGTHPPSQRRPRLSCVVKPLGGRSGALLAVRGPAADVAKLCRGGPETLREIARKDLTPKYPSSAATCTCSDTDCNSDTDKSERAGLEAGHQGLFCDSAKHADAAHVRQVLLAAQQFSLEGWRPLVFAARLLTAEELALYIQLSEEASDSMYRYEERHEQVIKNFEVNLQVSQLQPPLHPKEK